MSATVSEAVAAGTMSEEERKLRVELGACYRIFDYMGWTELIYNHITVKIPGPEHHFLINPYGLHYNEVTASNLVKIDLAGNIVGDATYPVNPAGFVIHSAIHEARPDVVCIAHTHTTEGMAVACREGGMRHDNFYSCLLTHLVGYHDFEGITVRPEEKVNLINSLGDKNYLILRHHGLLTCGPSVAAAFQYMWALQRSCEVEVAASAGGAAVIPLPEELGRNSAQLAEKMTLGGDWGQLEFAAMRRQIDRIDASYQE